MLTMEGRSDPSMRHTKADFDRVEGGAAFGLNDTSELAEGLDRAGRPRTLVRKNGRSGWGFGLAHWHFSSPFFASTSLHQLFQIHILDKTSVANRRLAKTGKMFLLKLKEVPCDVRSWVHVRMVPP